MNKILLGLSCLALLCACNQQKEVSEPTLTPQDVKILNEKIENPVLGELTLKLTPELADEVEARTDSEGKVRFAEVKSMELATAQLGIVSLQRLFPYAGKFEERTRKEGLHLWYVVKFDETKALTKASSEFGSIPGVSIIEYNPQIELVGNPQVTEYIQSEAAAPMAKAPFNDPLLFNQWHYYNEGIVAGSLSGCDINVFPVWRSYTTGKSDVVVAIVDGGIDFEHEDLADNMWHNPEKGGDQQYGYNFINHAYKIIAHDHGTHVAGTVAAVNNNGVGVAGVAGGNKAKGQAGVRLMSCQIFDNDKGNGSGPEAIKWAADNGAVIAQNSWGYVDAKETPQSLIAAVDYFTKYAGLDQNNKQVGPMRGGLVIFSAGNEDKPYSGNMYDGLLAVSSVGADYRKAYYSCYGDWVDVAAPGGDQSKGNQVLSTLPGNRYGYMQGTSMACPHVSGVAALIVSQFGGMGFSNVELRAKIENTTTDISSFNRAYYIGKGLVNAYKAIAGSTGKAPDEVTGLSASAKSNNITFSLTIPKDEDDGKPNTIIIYYDTKPITDGSGAMFTSFYVEDLEVGDVLSDTFGGLEFNTEYYISAAACDLGGNKSELCQDINVTTGGNNPPYINALDSVNWTLKPHEKAHINFEYGDEDNHYCTIELIKGYQELVSEEFTAPAAEILDTLDFSKPALDIVAVNAPTGKYDSKILITDVYGLNTTLDIHYEILENHIPKVVKQFEDMVIGGRNQAIKLKASEYFVDEDDEPLSYKITNTNESVANVNYNKGEIFITSLNFGYSDIKIVVTDARGTTAEQSFKILVRDSKEPVDVYPNPVRDYLYVRTSEELTNNVQIFSSLGAVVYSKEHTISAFEPAKIDVREFGAGIYTVVVGDVRKTVVKL